METIEVRIPAATPLFIEVDANHFGQLFASMNDVDQANVLLAMIQHMRPFQMQWDHIACRLDASNDYREVSDMFRNLSGDIGRAAPDMLAALEGLHHILARAESNASGNLEWEAVSGRINAARAAIAKATGAA